MLVLLKQIIFMSIFRVGHFYCEFHWWALLGYINDGVNIKIVPYITVTALVIIIIDELSVISYEIIFETLPSLALPKIILITKWSWLYFAITSFQVMNLTWYHTNNCTVRTVEIQTQINKVYFWRFESVSTDSRLSWFTYTKAFSKSHVTCLQRITEHIHIWWCMSQFNVTLVITKSLCVHEIIN